jgi:hypothetical protein
LTAPHNGFVVLAEGLHVAVYRNYAVDSNVSCWQMEKVWLYGRLVFEHDETACPHRLKAFATLGEAAVIGEKWTTPSILIIPWN